MGVRRCGGAEVWKEVRTAMAWDGMTYLMGRTRTGKDRHAWSRADPVVVGRVVEILASALGVMPPQRGRGRPRVSRIPSEKSGLSGAARSGGSAPTDRESARRRLQRLPAVRTSRPRRPQLLWDDVLP